MIETLAYILSSLSANVCQFKKLLLLQARFKVRDIIEENAYCVTNYSDLMPFTSMEEEAHIKNRVTANTFLLFLMEFLGCVRC